MWSGEHRRSARILELGARKAESMKSQKTNNEMSKVATEQDSGTGPEHSCQKRGKRKVNFRPVEELGVKATDHQVEKADTGCNEVHHMHTATVPSTTPMPEKSKLELLLGILQRRDTHNIFSEPVNGGEVEHYYDVIKEPMDFGKIARKLKEGEYSTLEEFEYDVFLISSNAMLFNASTTIYYRQARAIKELAKKLFHALRTDPENFESDFSLKRKATVRRVNTEAGILNLNSCDNTNHGCREEDSEADRRGTYRPWTSFLSENKSLVSAVYKIAKDLVLNDDAGIGYIKSLMHFAEDLGPTGAKVARHMAESYIAERVKESKLNHQPLGLGMQSNTMGSIQKSIRVAPSLELPGNSVGCQTLTGGYMGMQNSILLEKASAANTVNINDATSRNMDQLFDKMQTLGKFQGKMVQINSQRTDPGIAFEDHTIYQSAGIQLSSPLHKHETEGGKFNVPTSEDLNNLDNVSFLKMMQDAMLVDSPMAVIDMASSVVRMPELGYRTNNPGSSSSWSWPSKAMTGLSSSQAVAYLDGQAVKGLSHSQAIGYLNTPTMKGSICSKSLGCFNTSAMTGSSSKQSVGYLDSSATAGSSCNLAVSYLDAPARTTPCHNLASGYPDKMHLPNLDGGARVHQNQVNFAGEGSSYGGIPSDGDLLIDWIEPIELGLLSTVDVWSQQQGGATQSNLLSEAGPSQQQGWAVTSPSVGQIPKEAGLVKNAYEGYQFAEPGMVPITGLPDNQQQPVWTVTSHAIGQTSKGNEAIEYAYGRHQSADPEIVGIGGLQENQQQLGWMVTSFPMGQTSEGAGASKHVNARYQSASPKMVGIRGLPDNQLQPCWTITSPLIGQTSTVTGMPRYAYDGYQSTDSEMVEIRGLLDNQQQSGWTVTSPLVGQTSKGAEATKYAYEGYQSTDLEMVGIRGLPDNRQQPSWTAISPRIGQTSERARANKYACQLADPEMIGIRCLQDGQQQSGWSFSPPTDCQVNEPPNMYRFLAPSGGKLSIGEHTDNSQGQGWASNAVVDGQSRKALSLRDNDRISMPSLGESSGRQPVDNHQRQPIAEKELLPPWLLGP